MNVRVLKVMPEASFECASASFTADTFNARLEIFDRDEEPVACINFVNVCAYRFANEGHAKGIADGSINQVVEVIDSMWPDQLREPSLWPYVKRHFAISVEEIGYYEVLAEEVKVGRMSK